MVEITIGSGADRRTAGHPAPAGPAEPAAGGETGTLYVGRHRQPASGPDGPVVVMVAAPA
ncbi:hypothetical protein [Actinoplanes sp. NPDC020271]|uniref:hypothetical protein n=1 Tax=Actinoplanes sp. NPDC020271 TaxID=3363896 RepID=UPI00379A5842